MSRTYDTLSPRTNNYNSETMIMDKKDNTYRELVGPNWENSCHNCIDGDICMFAKKGWICNQWELRGQDESDNDD